MATLDQIAEALKRADAAGDTAGATKLALAYRQMQQQVPPQAPTAQPPVQTPPEPDFGTKLMNATGATVNGLVNGIPILGPLAQKATDVMGGGIAQLTGGNFNDYVKHQEDVRQDYADAAPAASIAGNVGGALATFGGVGAIPAGAEALGLTGAKTLPRVINGLLSTQAIGTADNIARGQKPTDAALNAVLPAVAGGVGGPLIGKGVEALGGKIASSLTEAAQNKVTKSAIANASTGSALRKEGSNLFGSSVDVVEPLPMADHTMGRLMQSVQQGLERYRPNERNDSAVVGLLSHLQGLAESSSTPGKVVDLKDLHLARQFAQEVQAGGTGTDRQSTMAGIVVHKIDDLVRTLKPTDILGGADPKQGANDLLRGIATWSKARKVGLVESAIKAADTYKSGVENGLKLSFLKLMKTPDYARLSHVEQNAIRQVAKGSTRQNIAEGLGKLGFSLGSGAAHNILGGTAGTGLATAALTPVLGPAAFPVALAGTTAVGALGRRVAEKMAIGGANRAAQVLASNVPSVSQVPNMLSRKPVEILIRGGASGLGK